MTEEILINVTAKEVRIALLENHILQEIYIERILKQGLLGNIYKGKVTRLLPGIQAAFVDIGLPRAAFLHISDIDVHSHQNIRDLLHPGLELLVQVYKDPLGSKGARLTTKFTLPSRYLVMTPYHSQLTVSQKITDDVERGRLQAMLSPIENEGYIFRTAAWGVQQADIDIDQKFLHHLWSNILKKSQTTQLGSMIYAEIPIVLRVLRDFASDDVSRIRVDNLEVVQQMQEFAATYMPAIENRIEFYADKRPIFDIHFVEDEIEKALARKVHLKSGGHLVFDQTEAMTTIDVNTGSYVGHGIIEETIFKTNLEAAEVIARQVRLRNLGGIIIIDFIDMTDVFHKEHLLQIFRKALSKDKARVEISELSSLSLIQMTRKRTRESLEHVLCIACPLCQKKGSIKSKETICYDIFREIKRIAENYPWAGFLVLAEESIITTLLEEEVSMLKALEMQLNRPIKLQSENSYTQEQFDVLPLAEKE